MGLGLAPSGSQDGTLTTLAITGISPSTGSTGGGTAVTITGRGFELGMTAKINGVLCTSLVVTSANTLTCVTPAGTGSGRDVRLDRTTTAANATLAGGWSYDFSPIDLSPPVLFFSDTGTTGSPSITAWANQGTSAATYDLANSGSNTISASGGPNGEPRINATGTARMTGTLYPVNTSADFAVWVVARVTSTTLDSVVWVNERLFFYSAAGGGAWHLFSQGALDLTHATATSGGWQCIELIGTNVAAGSYNLAWRVDGVLSSHAGVGYVAGGALPLSMGGSNNPNVPSNASADVDTAFSIIVPGTVSGANITKMRAWLASTYGVTA